ncbi:MAG: STAS domain-containing protein [Oligoflexia bacterium]
MKTHIRKSGNTVVVSIDGKIDYETQVPLREELMKISRNKTDSAPNKVIFNLKNLEFVGSSGISNLVQTLKDFNSRSELKPRYCHVRSEFQKVIKAFDENSDFEIFDTEERAISSFDN